MELNVNESNESFIESEEGNEADEEQSLEESSEDIELESEVCFSVHSSVYVE